MSSSTKIVITLDDYEMWLGCRGKEPNRHYCISGFDVQHYNKTWFKTPNSLGYMP